MLFKRRNKLPIVDRFLSVLWPRNGWNRAFKYILFRVQRLSGTPAAIANGVAIGVAVSFSPFLGAHLILCGFLSWLFGANAIAAVLGSLIGNPWTFPFIWVMVFYTGAFFVGDLGVELPEFTSLFANMIEAVLTLNWELFVNDVWPMIFVMIIGCIPFVVFSWFLTFFLLKNFITKFRNIRERRKNIIKMKKLKGKAVGVKNIIPEKLKDIKEKIVEHKK